MSERCSVPPSRRTFLHAAGAIAGGAAVARWLPVDLSAAAPGVQQTSPVDQLAARRAQMGAIPIERLPLDGNLFMLSGPGGNVLVLHGPEGTVVVDGFVQPAWGSLKAILDAVSGGRIARLINTHWHFDHTDNNANFHAAGSDILAHENTKKRLSEPHDVIGMHIDPSPAAALPTRTLGTAWTFQANGEELALEHFAPAHTDTDIYVRYRRANVLHMGDVFFNGFYPFIDASTGGHINGMIAGATRAMALVNARTKVVPGHGPLGDRKALTAYRDMMASIRDGVQKLKAAGRTRAEVQAAKPSAAFDAAWGKGMMGPDDFVAQVYDTLP